MDIYKGWYHVRFTGADIAETTAQDIADRLPHGSGIDTNWTVTVHRNGALTARTEFHLMDENGYYSGWQPVSVKLRHDGTRWRVERVTAGRERGLTYGLADMLWETVDYAFEPRTTGEVGA